MKVIIYIFILLLFAGCENQPYNKDTAANKPDSIAADTPSAEKSLIQYTETELEHFLDSVGNLATQPMANTVSWVADSTFKNQQQMDRLVSDANFLKLKKAIQAKDEMDRMLDLPTVKSIFGNIQVDSSFLEEGKVPITFYSFDKRKTDLNEFAICLGYPDMAWSCVLYFFKGNKIIAKHAIYHRYGLEIAHYKDKDNKTIIYYKENFGSGTGIWQFNYYFYTYHHGKLIPILNELENGNLQCCWGLRMYWLESVIVKKNPLTMKMVYYQELYDTSGIGHRIIDDSTLVEYTWDEKNQTLVGNYEQAKINKPQILSYYLADNELLFIHAYYKTLKHQLNDKIKRSLIFDYLNRIKNHYEN